MFSAAPASAVAYAPAPALLTEIAVPAPQITLPKSKGMMFNGQRFYKVKTLSELFHISTSAIHEQCNDGMIKFIVHPADRRKMKLIPESEVVRMIATMKR